MGLDLWFREDVARILASTQETMQNSLGMVAPLDLETAGAYQAGFGDALRALAIAFGVQSPAVAPGLRQETRLGVQAPHRGMRQDPYNGSNRHQ